LLHEKFKDSHDKDQYWNIHNLTLSVDWCVNRRIILYLQHFIEENRIKYLRRVNDYSEYSQDKRNRTGFERIKWTGEIDKIKILIYTSVRKHVIICPSKESNGYDE